MAATVERLALCIALGATLGLIASVSRADWLLTAAAVYSLGIAWLPGLALVGLWLAGRRQVLSGVIAFACSAAFANYLLNRAILPGQLVAHAWVYALHLLLASLFLSALAAQGARQIERPGT